MIFAQGFLMGVSQSFFDLSRRLQLSLANGQKIIGLVRRKSLVCQGKPG
jgi:hypothetical protein